MSNAAPQSMPGAAFLLMPCPQCGESRLHTIRQLVRNLSVPCNHCASAKRVDSPEIRRRLENTAQDLQDLVRRLGNGAPS